MPNRHSLKICLNCGSILHSQKSEDHKRRICSECGHNIAEISLRQVEDLDKVSDYCFVCLKRGDNYQILFEDDSTVVYKCKNCKNLDGYTYADQQEDWQDYESFDLDESQFSEFQIELAKQEGTRILSASTSKIIAE